MHPQFEIPTNDPGFCKIFEIVSVTFFAHGNFFPNNVQKLREKYLCVLCNPGS